MKKFLTLVLALVLAFALTAPAMAFTSDNADDEEEYPYDLSIYLVEYDDNDFFGLVTLPESDRGYAKNEIVAAIVSLYVPKDEDPYDDDFKTLEITGDNVNFKVSDDSEAGDDAPDLKHMPDKSDGWEYDLVDDRLEGKDTYQWLVFAKITDDDASMTAKLVQGSAGEEFDDEDDTISVTLNGNDYTIEKDYDEDYGGTYTIEDEKYGDKVIIYIDEDYESEGMAIFADKYNTTFDLGVTTKNKLGIVDGASIDTSSDEWEDVMEIYEDIAVDDFGLDYFNIGNYVRDSFFEDLESADTIVATVDIKPWTAYVTIPDTTEIIVDPPKTGDAASMLGMLMVALSGAGALALKKRG